MSRRPSGKVRNSLVAVSSAAIMAVYAAGYSRTRAAADRLEAQSSERRPALHPEGRSAIAEPAQLTRVEPAPARFPEIEPRPLAKSFARQVAPVEQPLTSAPTAAPAPVEAPSLVADKAEPAPPPPPPPPAPKWKDGTYTGWGTSRHGDIQASVIIENGHIKEATIAQCLTRYSCDIIDKLPPQVAQRQSPETDFVSGATQSTNAFYYGVVEALAKASDAAKADAVRTN